MASGFSYPVIPMVATPSVSSTSKKTGHDRRKEKNALPVPFYFYRKDTKCVHGAFVVCRCSELGDYQHVRWTIDCGALLQQPFQIDALHSKYRGVIFELVPEVEAKLRLHGELEAGLTINHHYHVFSRAKWRVWAFDGDNGMAEKLAYSPSTFHSKQTVAKLLGITPVPLEQDVQELLEPAAEHEFGGTDEPAAANQPPRVAVPSSPHAAIAERLSGMSREMEGAVTHRFGPDAYLCCIKLASNMKPSATFENTLADAVGVLLGPGARQLQDDLRSKTFHLPSQASMRMARTRLDLLWKKWEQQPPLDVAKRIRIRYYDSSPILGRNLLCGREDRFDIPMDTSDVDLPYINLTFFFQSTEIISLRTWKGRGELSKKDSQYLA